jgi:hypothetical protein
LILENFQIAGSGGFFDSENIPKNWNQRFFDFQIFLKTKTRGCKKENSDTHPTLQQTQLGC